MMKDIEVLKSATLNKTLVLEIGAIMGEFVIVEPNVETTETKLPETTIQPRQIEELPLNGRRFTTMGLIPAPAQKQKPKKKN